MALSKGTLATLLELRSSLDQYWDDWPRGTKKVEVALTRKELCAVLDLIDSHEMVPTLLDDISKAVFNARHYLGRLPTKNV